MGLFINFQVSLLNFPKDLVQEREIPKLILVVLEEQLLGVYENGELKFCYPVSTGRSAKPTPLGRFKIFYKSKYHISTIYGDPMPWMLAFTKYHALHAGDISKPYASHGCVRLFLWDAERLYFWANNGTTVLIVDSFSILKSSQ